MAKGDSNTKFFHGKASYRKKVNYIPYLINDEGERIEDQQDICSMVNDYCLNVFASSCTSQATSVMVEQIAVSESQNISLLSELTFEEFEMAVIQMHPNKASGPDGLNPWFFQHFWSLLGREIFSCCKLWLIDCTFPA